MLQFQSLATYGVEDLVANAIIYGLLATTFFIPLRTLVSVM